jgi:hypothetical protein
MPSTRASEGAKPSGLPVQPYIGKRCNLSARETQRVIVRE